MQSICPCDRPPLTSARLPGRHAAVLALILICVLLSMLIGMSRCRKKHAAAAVAPVIAPVVAPAPEPVVKIVEKIVEVEKIVPGPAPEPVILKESTPDAALQLLGLLQQQARFIDFIKEDLSPSAMRISASRRASCMKAATR